MEENSQHTSNTRDTVIQTDDIETSTDNNITETYNVTLHLVDDGDEDAVLPVHQNISRKKYTGKQLEQPYACPGIGHGPSRFSPPCQGQDAWEASRGIMNPIHAVTPLELAVVLQQGLKPIYTLCHGLLAGFALAHCIMVGSVDLERHDMMKLAELYPYMAFSVQSTYYFLAMLCLLSILDRFDIAHIDVFHISAMIHYRLSDVILLLLYLSVIVMTIVTTRWDERFAMPPYRKSRRDVVALWGDKNELYEEFVVWKKLSLFRGICAILGWGCVVVCNGEDMLHLHLANMIKYQATEKC